jgi:hypothetical protein
MQLFDSVIDRNRPDGKKYVSFRLGRGSILFSVNDDAQNYVARSKKMFVTEDLKSETINGK